MSRSTTKFGWRPLATAAALALSVLTPVASAAPMTSALLGEHSGAVRYRSARVQGLDIFYREAGPERGPVVLLLHGFPSSSFMFRELIPKLADRYRVIAPDYPGFGQSSFPERGAFAYTFEHLARVMTSFTDALKLSRYALYVQDYGAPIGLRLALARPERVTALVVQNGNAYEEGLSREAWEPLRRYWREPTAAHREALRQWLSPEGVRQQYSAGLPEPLLRRLSPDTWTLDWARMSRPGNVDAQLDLFGDYQTNVALYPRFHELFRARRFPTLIVWGRHDIFFTPAGAEAYKRDLPDAELVLLDAGHFALETHADEIAQRMRTFLARIP
jgi:pimeloyl-ACP methyl ester carboxylesterase